LKPNFASIEEIENYAEGTASSLLYLTLEAAEMKNVEMDHVASHLGKGISFPFLFRMSNYGRKKKNRHFLEYLGQI